MALPGRPPEPPARTGPPVLERYGLAGIMLATPWIGVYATTAALEFFGMSRRKIWAAIGLSLAAHAIVVTLLYQKDLGGCQQG